jgi:hypothetical protein
MYRVNAERSQEKNDRIEGDAHGTKVTSTPPTKFFACRGGRKVILRLRFAEFFAPCRRRIEIRRDKKKETAYVKRSALFRTL